MVLIAYLNMHNRDDNDNARVEHSAIRCAYVTRMQFPYVSMWTNVDNKAIIASYMEIRLVILLIANQIFVEFGYLLFQCSIKHRNVFRLYNVYVYCA